MSHKLCLGLDTDELLIINNLLKDISTSQIQPDYFKLNPSFLNMDSNAISIIAKWLNEYNFNWIFDAKYGDVYHTNQKLAKYVFEVLNASAVTLNPYSGTQALLPFFYYTSKKCFVLLKTTSNNEKQNLLWKHIVQETKKYPNVHYIAPATDPNFLLELLSYLPIDKLILSPGIGAQGGSISIPSPRIIYSASRSILSCGENASKQVDFYKNHSINKFYSTYLKDYILEGNFQLSNAGSSDCYVDLKSLYSNPEQINYISNVILNLINPDKNTVFVGVESAGIPLAAFLANKANLPFAYIRTSKKTYGTSKLLEGSIPLTSTIYLLDDVCTTGTSILNAKASLEKLGYKNIIPFVICLRNKQLKSIKHLFSV